MARQQISVRLTDDLLALVDEHAARTGKTRSELIRSALEEYLKRDREAAIDAAIVEGYGRIPAERHDPWAHAAASRSIAAEPW
jgi:metal-responsive CopG/Arc/MetJ family transcriptional regulator